MSKKRILIFIDWFIPGYKAGGPISSNANLIDHLNGQLEFYVITRNTDYCESTPYEHIKSDEWNTLPSGAHVYYISKNQLSFSQLIKITRTITFDSVFVNGIYSLYFSFFPLIWFKYFSKKHLVVSARGMLSEQTFSSKKLKKKIFYLMARLFNLYKGVVIHATNEEELIQIRRNLGFKGEIRIASNLPPKIQYPLHHISKIAGELRLVSIARISPEKNTLFALNILKELFLEYKQPANPANVVFDLYGSVYDESYWKECRSVIKLLPPAVSVSWLGPVERERVHEIIQNYHFLFMPSQGENYGHSIIESFLAGRPVIISDHTPWRNLQLSHSEIRNPKSEIITPSSPIGWDLPLDEPQKFIEAINTCIQMNQAEYDIMSKSALEHAKSIVNNSSIIDANLKLFENSPG
jgi:glycosyltransferase involved in cell wall biosynthesis